MAPLSSVQSRPIALSPSVEGQVYALFAVAMGLTVFGVWLGMSVALPFVAQWGIVLLIAELAIILTAGLWMNTSPLNYLLFGLFPILSGLTFTPYLLYILQAYANGASILINALSATATASLAAAIFARTTSWNLSGMRGALFFAVIGLIVMSLLQLFIPGLRSTQFELLLSGAGIIVFSLFTAYDIQRIQAQGRAGASPFLLALSLYLDIYNLFLYILRFMVAFSGDRR